MGLIICLYGADGSGKTTLARLLSKYLYVKHYFVRIVWIRGTHTFSSLLARFVGHFEVFKGKCNLYYNICIPSKMQFLWLWIEYASIIPIIIYRFILPKKLGRIVIAERSFIDFLVWLLITLGYKQIITSFVAKSIFSIAGSLCDKLIYIHAKQEVLLLRREGHSDFNLITKQLPLYKKFSNFLCSETLDTSYTNTDENLKKIIRIIGDQL